MLDSSPDARTPDQGDCMNAMSINPSPFTPLRVGCAQGEVGRGMGLILEATLLKMIVLTHPHPCPPLEREGNNDTSNRRLILLAFMQSPCTPDPVFGPTPFLT
jgi:hypothetical protein